MQSTGNDIISGPVGTICKLERVQCGGERGCDVIQDCLLKALDGDGSERHSADG